MAGENRKRSWRRPDSYAGDDPMRFDLASRFRRAPSRLHALCAAALRLYRTRALGFALFAAAPAVLAQSPRYTIHDLGPLHGKSLGTGYGVTGINDNGQVIGYDTRPDGNVRAFRTAPNAAIDWSTDDLGTLGGAVSRARGINSSGQVVGESTTSFGETHGFRTAANAPINAAADDIGTLGGPETRALAINDAGEVTGSSETFLPGTSVRLPAAFRTAPNKPIDPAAGNIDPERAAKSPHTSTGRYINRAGDVLGEFTGGASNYPAAFLYKDGASTRLGFVRFIDQDFTGVTGQDQIVFNTAQRLYVWQNGAETLLATCPAACVPSSVNNSLEIVGSLAARPGNSEHPFLYSAGAVFDVNDLIPSGSGWVLESLNRGLPAWFINERGQIAGVGQFRGETHAVRLDPVTSSSQAVE
jgi:probable HAF family extracellular repeat protein